MNDDDICHVNNENVVNGDNDDDIYHSPRMFKSEFFIGPGESDAAPEED